MPDRHLQKVSYGIEMYPAVSTQPKFLNEQIQNEYSMYLYINRQWWVTKSVSSSSSSRIQFGAVYSVFLVTKRNRGQCC